MSELIHRSVALLAKMHREEDGLFSFAARETAAGLVNDFQNPGCIRYTINTLAGLQRAVDHGRIHWPVVDTLNRFLVHHTAEITSPADQGLLLAVLARANHLQTGAWFDRVAANTASSQRLSTFHLQDVSWMLIGLTAYAAETDNAAARAASEKLFRFIDRRFLNKDRMLPYYRLAWWRRRFSSFGGIVYFLCAMSDYAEAFSDTYADVVFRESAAQVMALQGPKGEWPWFIDVERAVVADWYPVYSVHQHSMSLLFLFPALDRSVAGADAAIRKSVLWLFGQNELGVSFLRLDPFFIDRSIRRNESAERPRRLLRAALAALLGRPARPVPASDLAILKECRSYELGWILYAWSPRKDFLEFQELHPARLASDGPAVNLTSSPSTALPGTL